MLFSTYKTPLTVYVGGVFFFVKAYIDCLYPCIGKQLKAIYYYLDITKVLVLKCWASLEQDKKYKPFEILQMSITSPLL